MVSSELYSLLCTKFSGIEQSNYIIVVLQAKIVRQHSKQM